MELLIQNKMYTPHHDHKHYNLDQLYYIISIHIYQDSTNNQKYISHIKATESGFIYRNLAKEILNKSNHQVRELLLNMWCKFQDL